MMEFLVIVIAGLALLLFDGVAQSMNRIATALESLDKKYPQV